MRTKNPEAAMHQALEQARHGSRVGHHVILTVGGKSFYIVAIPLNDNLRPANENDAAFSKPWMPDFLDWLGKGRTVREAAELSGVSKRHAHRSYHRDLRFAEAWDAIKRSLRDVPRVTPTRAGKATTPTTVRI